MLIGLVSTGGTISGLVTDGVVHSPADTELPAWLAAEFSAIDWLLSAPLNVMSENLGPGDWHTIEGAVRSLIDRGADGILVLHGTDTMSYTAAALSVLLDDVDAPVALTGSRLPGAVAGSDAPTNIRAALRWLEAAATGVFVVFAGIADAPAAVYLGSHVRKVRATGGAYASALERPWATVGPSDEITRHLAVTEDAGTAGASPDLAWPHPGRPEAPRTTALLIRVYPGIDFAAHAALVDAAAAGCVVLELFPSGTAPTATPDFAAFVGHCHRSGVAIVAAVPSPLRGAHLAYASTVDLHALGVHLLTDVTPELLYVKAVLAPVTLETELVAWLRRRSRTERLVPVAD